MAQGLTLTEACRKPDVLWTMETVRKLAGRGRHFAAAHNRAYREMLQQWTDQIVLDLKEAEKDRDEILRARYLADNRKWIISKMLSEFQDKGKVDFDGLAGAPTITINVTSNPAAKAIDVTPSKPTNQGQTKPQLELTCPAPRSKPSGEEE
jgi:hypothetical protein